MWEKYGKLLCGSSEASEYIDSVIVQAIDADDNGIEIFGTIVVGIRFHTLSDIIESFVPRYVDDEKVQRGFDHALNFVTSYLKRQLKLAKELFEIALPNIRNAISEELSCFQVPEQNFNLSFSDDHFSCSFNFKNRAVQMVWAADIGFIGIFLPGKTATIS